VVTEVHHDERVLLPMVSGSFVVRCVTFDRSRVSCFCEVVTIIHLGAAILGALSSTLVDSEESSVLLDVTV
jgi:hypothetical protein